MESCSPAPGEAQTSPWGGAFVGSAPGTDQLVTRLLAEFNRCGRKVYQVPGNMLH